MGTPTEEAPAEELFVEQLCVHRIELSGDPTEKSARLCFQSRNSAATGESVVKAQRYWHECIVCYDGLFPLVPRNGEIRRQSEALFPRVLICGDGFVRPWRPPGCLHGRVPG